MSTNLFIHISPLVNLLKLYQMYNLYELCTFYALFCNYFNNDVLETN